MNQLIVANTSIRQNSDGLYHLNDLHKASGGENKHRPNYFLTNIQTKELIDELESNTGIPALLSVHGGLDKGTYVAKEIVYAYAMWISPKFNLQVIRAYNDLVTGNTAVNSLSPYTDPTAFVRTHAAMLTLAKMNGFTGNQAVFSADRGTKRLTGTSSLELLGSDLIAESKEKLMTPTEVGRLAGGLSAQKVNSLLADVGFQTSYIATDKSKAWKLTDDGKEFAEMIDVGKKYIDGTPIQQIKWYANVVDKITTAATLH